MSLEIEPASFRLVAQCLYELRYHIHVKVTFLKRKGPSESYCCFYEAVTHILNIGFISFFCLTVIEICYVI